MRLFAIALVILCVGCGSKGAAPKLSGSWKDDRLNSLVITNEDHYLLTLGGVIPIEGKVTIEGRNFTLTPETVMGLTRDEQTKLAKPGKVFGGNNSNKPVTGTLSEDGKTLTLDYYGKSKLTLKPYTVAQKKTGPDSVTEAERKLVGEYIEKIDLTKAKPTEREQLKRVSEMPMATKSKLKLLVDNSFELTIGFLIEGRWTVQEDKVILQISRERGEAVGKRQPWAFLIKDGVLWSLDAGKVSPYSYVRR